MHWERYIKDFVSYLKIERGLSENSIFAYQSDVIKLKDYSIENRLEPNQIDLAYLKTFIAELFDLGLSPRSQARIISGIKQFFLFLLIEKLIENDPSELLEMPSIGKKLPEVMTIEEIDRIIGAIDLSKNEHFLNKENTLFCDEVHKTYKANKLVANLLQLYIKEFK